MLSALLAVAHRSYGQFRANSIFLWVKKSCFFLPYQGNDFPHCEKSAPILIRLEQGCVQDRDC
jgi:hypothetical protein